MATSEIVRARIEHVLQLCGRLRQCDQEEVYAATGLDPDDALACSFQVSLWCRAFLHGGRAVALFGVAADPRDPELGSPWMLGSDEIAAHRNYVAKLSRRYVCSMLADFAILENWVDARHETSIRWLRWCGFHIEEPQPWGWSQMPFRRFWMRRDERCALPT